MSPSFPLSPLQIKQHNFTLVHIQVIEGGSTTAEPSLIPEISHEQDLKDPNQWRLFLLLKLGSEDATKRFAYEATIGIQGLVEVKDHRLQEQKEFLALVNGFSVLYSAAREMLLNVTARSGKGAVTLPTISFVSLVKDRLQQKATAGPTPSPPPVPAQR